MEVRKFLVALLIAVPAAAVQEWRAPALASFNEVWQTINDTFYDPTFGGVDWDAVRVELRPKAEAADSAEGVRRVITEMLGRLKRSHYMVLSASARGDDGPMGQATVPIEVRLSPSGIVVTSVEAGSSATRAGLRAGQILEAIDGRTERELTAAAHGGDERTRAYDAWRRVLRALHGGSGSTAQLRVVDPRDGAKAVGVERTAESGQLVTVGNLPALHVRVDARETRSPDRRRVGVIGFSVWMPPVNDTVATAVDRFRQADGLVIDLRGNPGGLASMMNGVAGQLLAEPKLLGTMQTRAALLEFHANPRLSMPDGRRVVPFAGPVAILVDELSASTSECFAGALQSLGRARVFGRQTLGAALPSSTRRLPTGDVLMYALGDFVTAAGRRIEGEGVVPDEVVPLDAAAIAALAGGRDPVLEAALKWIDRQKGSR